ncbi:MAG TPA: hypothetical protein VE865_07315 [Bradyrhizobium sp.]|nr:hypothetical protein [Bradyrhizobium sp.]
MATPLNRDAVLDAFDRIARAAVAAGTKLQIAVYGGSALMLASNFRFATEDVDVSELERPLPDWLARVVHEMQTRIVGRTNGSTMESHSISVRSRIARQIIWSSGRFLGTAPPRGLSSQSRRQNICWP